MDTTTSDQNAIDPQAARALSPNTVVAQVKAFDPELHCKLIDYRDRNNLTLADLARELESSTALVSKYIAGKPVGDVGKFEANIEDVLKTAKTRSINKVRLIETQVSRVMAGVFARIRKTNDFGAIFGAAGIGKTCGIGRFVIDNPTTIAIAPMEGEGTRTGLVKLLFGEMETRGWNGYESRADFILDRLKGSNRLVIVDQAQRLHSSGLSFLFDLHDKTGAPFSLVGNPEIMKRIQSNDQQFSRIGYVKHVSLTEDVQQTADAIVEQVVPGASRELKGMAKQVLKNAGHGRALRKQLILAKEIAETAAFRAEHGNDLRLAFRSAHTCLVRDYLLEDK